MMPDDSMDTTAGAGDRERVLLCQMYAQAHKLARTFSHTYITCTLVHTMDTPKGGEFHSSMQLADSNETSARIGDRRRLLA